MAATATERKLLIGGEWIETGDWVEVRSPFSREVVGRVARGGADEARRAIDAAERALAEPLPAHKRAEILGKVAGLIGRRHEEVARTISDEAGKPIKTARVEASRAMSTYTFAAVEARKLAGEMIPFDSAQAGEGKLGFTIRKPIGIVGAISPFNFPCNLVAHKLAPALAAGCPVVLKPASQTPLSALLLAELEQEAGLPDGWLNVIVGPSGEIGDVLVQDERVRMITFTGSSGVGWGIAERAAKKRVRLELAEAPESAHVVCDEVFGPVCVVNAVDSLTDAYERANGTEYGLQAGIFTGSIATALAAAEALEFGGVTVNEAPTFRADQMPYGGVKGSGNTKEGPAYTIREKTEERLGVLQA